jgi:hypothetical protein
MKKLKIIALVVLFFIPLTIFSKSTSATLTLTGRVPVIIYTSPGTNGATNVFHNIPLVLQPDCVIVSDTQMSCTGSTVTIETVE